MALSLSCSFVIYDSPFSEIKRCIEQLIIIIPAEIIFSIYVIDNGIALRREENLETLCCQHFSHINFYFIKSSKNGGYGYGHNQAIFRSNADYHLILNTDICFYNDTLINAFKFMQTHSSVGMLVPDVLDIKEKRVHLCRQNPSLKIAFLRRFAPRWLKRVYNKQLNQFEKRENNYDKPMFNLTNPTGCFMLCRLDYLKKIGGFDERFFLYYEDADLGRRMATLAPIAYAPTVKIKHTWKRAAYSKKYKYLTFVAIKSALYYSWKWSFK